SMDRQRQPNGSEARLRRLGSWYRQPRPRPERRVHDGHRPRSRSFRFEAADERLRDRFDPGEGHESQRDAVAMIDSSAVRVLDRSSVAEVRRVSLDHTMRLEWSESARGNAAIVATELAS